MTFLSSIQCVKHRSKIKLKHFSWYINNSNSCHILCTMAFTFCISFLLMKAHEISILCVCVWVAIYVQLRYSLLFSSLLQEGWTSTEVANRCESETQITYGFGNRCKQSFSSLCTALLCTHCWDYVGRIWKIKSQTNVQQVDPLIKDLSVEISVIRIKIISTR